MHGRRADGRLAKAAHGDLEIAAVAGGVFAVLHHLVAEEEVLVEAKGLRRFAQGRVAHVQGEEGVHVVAALDEGLLEGQAGVDRVAVIADGLAVHVQSAGAGDGDVLHTADVLQRGGGGQHLEGRSGGIQALGGAVPVDLAVLGDGGQVHRVKIGQADFGEHLACAVVQHHHRAVFAHGQLVPPEEFHNLGAKGAVQGQVNVVTLARRVGEQRVDALRQRRLEPV